MNEVFKKITFLVIILFWTKAALSCDLLSINIGGDKSDIEHYFGSIDDDTDLAVDPSLATKTIISNTFEEPEEKIVSVSTEIDDFCNNLNLGNSIFKAIILDDVIAAVGIEVINGSDNAESKEQLLYNYVTTTFGTIENSENPDWTGHKSWSVGDREIIYAKTLIIKTHMIEEVLVTNTKYISLISGYDE